MRLKMDTRSRRLLRRIPAINAYSATELLLLAALAVQVARLLWVLVTPVGPVGDWRPAQPGVAGSARDILTGFDPFFRLSGAGQPASVTALNLTLFGTRIDEASGRGSAIIAGADKLQKSIAVGEEIVPGVRLKSVSFDHVTIDRGGTSEDLYIDQSGAAPPLVQGADGAMLPTASATPGIAQLRQDIGFNPRIDNGRISGLVVRDRRAVAKCFGKRACATATSSPSIGGRPVTGPQDIDRIATDYRRVAAPFPSLSSAAARRLPLSHHDRARPNDHSISSVR